MSILKYKDPKTGEFKRINPYKADLSFVGKDGIVVNKAANSEMVEISGSGLVQNYNGPKGYYRAYVTDYTNWNTNMIIRQEGDNSANTILQRKADGSGEIVMPETPIDLSITNKKYVADNYVGKLKFTNLEQALNGYILDTTKEAYADLDSAVLKSSVAVGDNVYPIADKTRALVSRIEGKTTKMVQLLDKSTFPATSTPIAGVTVTKTDDGGLHVLGTSASSGGRASWGITVNVEKGHKYLSLIKGNNKIATPFVTLKSDTSQYVGFVADIVTSTIEGECYYGFNLAAEDYDETIYPQLFDLTAMNREDITTAEQFKAEFPDLYPYENGNIYPAKISGVKFTGKNLLKLELEPSLNAYNATASINGDILSITPTITEQKTCYAQLKTHLKAGKYTFSAVINNPNNISTQFILSKKVNAGDIVFQRYYTAPITFTIDEEQDFYILIYPIVKAIAPFKTASYQIQIQAESQATAYEPYIEPVSVTLPETYDLHGIGDYKDYLEITKNKDNELYTLKKVQSVEVNESEKTVTPLTTPVETVIATNLTYEQVTAIRHNGGLIEVEGNTNKGYARPTVTNTIVYRLTAANMAEV